MSAAFETARDFAAHGYPVFPTIGKVPFKGTQGFNDATTDEQQLLRWNERHPDANWAVACGEHFSVVDIDSKHGADPREIIEEYALTGPVVRTGEATDGPLEGVRGAHVYCQNGVPTGKTTVPGVEIRAGGAYVILPGSRHASGVPYEWQDDKRPWSQALAPVPTALVPKAPSSGPAPPVSMTIDAGSRNTTLTSLAGTMRRRGMSENAIAAALIVENRDRCTPEPLAESEVRAIARTIARYEPAGPALLPEPGDLHITRASDVRVQPVEFLFADRVPIGAVTLLAGDPGLGKSTWTCGLAAGVTAGRHGAPATVLIANAEDSPAHVVVPRLAAADANLDLVEFFSVNDKSTIVGQRPFELPGDVGRLEAHARDVKARLVVIDPLNAHLGDAVSSKSDHSVRRALAPLAGMAQRLGVAVVVVAHLNKAAGTDAIYRVGGSIGLVGGARSLLVFTRDPDDPDGDDGARRALGHVKSNWARLAPTLTYGHKEVTVTAGGATVQTNHLVRLGESDVAGSALLGVDADDPPASQQERAGELLADALGDGEWHRSKEIKEGAKRQGIGRRTLERAAHDASIEIDERGFPRVTWWRLPQLRQANGATVAPNAWRDCEIPVFTGDSGGPGVQSRQTPVNGATGGDIDDFQEATPAQEEQLYRAMRLLDDDGPTVER